jgi:N4-gp56 family major capsid protein
MAYNVQTTVYTDGGSPKRTYLNKEFYDRNLLEMAKTKFVHAKFGQKRNIPRGSGKKVEFRRWVPFAISQNYNELTEGITPDGQDLSQTHLEATVKQYGAFVEVSDLLKRTSYDDVALGATDMLGEQMGTVVEWVTRDAMCAGTNVMYAGTNTARNTILPSDKLTTTEIRKAVRELKKAKAPMITAGGKKPHYICIVSPDATFDLQSDSLWQDVSKYSNAEQIYSGEIGRLFGVVFVESTEAKIFKQTVHNAVNTNTSSSSSFVLKNTPTAAEVAFFSTPGNTFKIGSTDYTTVSYTAATKTVTMSTSASLSANDIVWTDDAGAANASTKIAPDVHAALMFGRDAYGTVDIEGSGAIRSIVKGFGEAGFDPLDQRATYGAKVEAYTALILNDDWLVRIEHGVTA